MITGNPYDALDQRLEQIQSEAEKTALTVFGLRTLLDRQSRGPSMWGLLLQHPLFITREQLAEKPLEEWSAEHDQRMLEYDARMAGVNVDTYLMLQQQENYINQRKLHHAE